jgi:prepilin peptidase CpaA
VISTGQDLPNNITSLALMVVVALAVRQDLVEHRIPNVLTFTALAIAVVIHSVLSGVDGFIYALAGAGVGLICLLPLYLFKGMGAGDVKLMGAVGAFLGPLNAFLAAAMTLIFGALLAVAVVVWRLVESRAAISGPPVSMSLVRKERFPYAIAIGLGAIATLWQRGILDGLLQGLMPG